MRAYAAFCYKELLESLRIYRLLIMLAAFTLFGLMSPLFAKFLPELMGTMELNGMSIQLPEPTAWDSWGQFFKNVGQMGTLVLILAFSGITANEFSKGTLVNILTKGMQRHTVIFAKFTISTIIWTIAYALSLGITFAYTLYFWSPVELNEALLSFAALWLFGLFILSLLILGGVILRNSYGGLLLAGGMLIALSLSGIIPKAANYNPLTLAGGTLSLLMGAQPVGDFYPAMAVTLAATLVCLVASILAFNKKQL